MNDSNTPESTEDQLPHEVVAAIRRQSGPPLNVSQTVENAILSDAAAHLSGIRKPNIKAKLVAISFRTRSPGQRHIDGYLAATVRRQRDSIGYRR